ncbi:hypothetical protein BJ138DRAFT_1168682, partial [Hygrophoropsis aurantiaca]
MFRASTRKRGQPSLPPLTLAGYQPRYMPQLFSLVIFQHYVQRLIIHGTVFAAVITAFNPTVMFIIRLLSLNPQKFTMLISHLDLAMFVSRYHHLLLHPHPLLRYYANLFHVRGKLYLKLLKVTAVTTFVLPFLFHQLIIGDILGMLVVGFAEVPCTRRGRRGFFQGGHMEWGIQGFQGSGQVIPGALR